MISVIIAAAGSGKRMGGSVKKQYRKVENLTVLEKTVKAFCSFPEIVIAGPKDDLDYIKGLFNLGSGEQSGAGSGTQSGTSLAVPMIKVVAGGETRCDSVWNALKECTGEYVLVHDAARCFVDSGVIGRVVDALVVGSVVVGSGTQSGTGSGTQSGVGSGAVIPGAVIPCVKPKSTIRTARETLDRSKLFEVQTPQGFRKEILVRAFEKARADGFSKIATDEGSLVDHLNAVNKAAVTSAGAPNEKDEIKITIVEGDYKNIKITTEDDMPKETNGLGAAAKIPRVGYGYDVHKLVEGRALMLGCIKVPYDKGLLGHSDADVLVHAIADAMLGAAGLRDIGYYFPDNAKETEGMAGAALLEKTLQLVEGAGYSIVNIDGTIVAQVPKLAPYIEQMITNIAKALHIEPKQVAVKATTEEGLGITGTGEAMAAHAVVTVKERN